MAQLFAIAFTMGIVGSFHCIGMCGPLALALPLNKNSVEAKFTGALIYNIGRVVTYSVFGLLFGLIGQTLALFGFQQWLSLATGLSIAIYLLLPGRFYFKVKPRNYISTFLTRLRAKLSLLFLNKNKSSLFAIGLLNGLLPCGLVYMAVAGAVAMGTVANSVLFMAAFGAGTLPAMWAVAFFGNYISVGIRKKIRGTYPVIMGLIACLLILRGMGLNIPYMSPRSAADKKAIECFDRH